MFQAYNRLIGIKKVKVHGKCSNDRYDYYSLPQKILEEFFS